VRFPIHEILWGLETSIVLGVHYAVHILASFAIFGGFWRADMRYRVNIYRLKKLEFNNQEVLETRCEASFVQVPDIQSDMVFPRLQSYPSSLRLDRSHRLQDEH